MSKLAFGLFLALILTVCNSGFASSHREAPYITEIPKCDGTDFYMFRSFQTGQEGNVILIANFIPLQDPNGGPNYFFMDPEALYEIHIDNNGDAIEDLTFQFRFTNNFIRAVGVVNELPLAAFADGTVFPPISDVNENALFVKETYTVTLVQGDRRKGTATLLNNITAGGTTFTKPFDNLGTKTIPDYDTYANSKIATIGLPNGQTGRVFVGQRREGFIVELGGVFDSIGLDASNLNTNNALRFKSTTSLVLELPIGFLLGNNTTNGVIGGWYTASLKQARLVNNDPNFQANKATFEGGPFAQVSRLGMPLVNELIIGIISKDTFNASEPKDDLQFESFFLNSNLALALQLVAGEATIPDAQLTNRQDLRATFLTGLNVAGLIQNQNGAFGEMIRLDTKIAPTAYDATDGNRLGVLEGDQAGFPNGRRPADDVVDIELQVVAGELNGNAGTGIIDNAIANFTVGVYYLDTFPFLATPIAGNLLDFPDDGFESTTK